MLGRKKNTSNEKWISVFNNISNTISFDEVEKETKKVLKEIYKNTKGKNVAYGYSGGKDSIVLAHLCNRAGINKGVFATSNLEYPAFDLWLVKNMPIGVETVNTGYDIKWLSKNQELLFPTPELENRTWANKVRFKVQKDYYFKNKLDIIMFGRRKVDGNFCGRGTNLYTNKNKMTIYNPISDWSHEQILGYIYYNNLKLPPMYEWKEGFTLGTHTWFTRNNHKSHDKIWEELYVIDKDLVLNASKYLDSAKRYLEVSLNEN